MKHILLQEAFIYRKRKALSAPAGFVYNKSAGAWFSEVTYDALVKNSQFPSIGTKKEDIETGEDHKGQ